MAGARSGLFMEQTRIAKEMRKSDEQRNVPAHLVRPRYLVWENVPGAFSSAEGEDFRAVIEEIVRIKYSACDVPRPESGRWESAGAVLLGDEFSLAWRVMSDKLLTEGNTAASIDELYLFLTNLTAIEYIRNFMKRVRKKESAVILASQNLEDFNIEHIRELTKPLFSIPTHAFLFNAGNIDKRFYIDSLQLEESEYNLIRFPQRGVCLYKCGIERYNLAVHAPAYKEKLFGTAGGR